LHIMKRFMLTLGACLWTQSGLHAEPAAALPTASHHMRMSLVAETEQPAKGKPYHIAIVFTPQEGWHGYGENPGESGYPTRFTWHGIADAPVLQWPVPEKQKFVGVTSFVYNGSYALLTTLPFPASATRQKITLDADYLVCNPTLCVPEKAQATLDLQAGTGAIRTETQAQFDTWNAALPQPLAGNTLYTLSTNNILTIAIPYPAQASLPDAPWLYGRSPNQIDAGAPQIFAHSGDWLMVRTQAGVMQAGQPLHAVVMLSGARALRFTATQGALPAAMPASGSIGWLALLALGGALLGGLILNIMPCVFPVIGLKALALARPHRDEAQVRREALAYSGGAIVVLTSLGGIILGVRALGSSIGWGFQLQDVRILLILTLLMLAMTMNLLNVYALPTLGGNAALNLKKGLWGDFFTGVFAAFVATPCTGPFMAAALGSALILPWVLALAVFAALGLGMALPFLALAYIPALRTRLPKPGAWMETFRKLMAIPMGLTALAGFWLIWGNTGLRGTLAALALASLILLLLALYGRRQRAGRDPLPRLTLLALITVLGAITALSVEYIHAQQSSRTAPSGLSHLHSEPFSEARLAALRAAHQPVFVFFTADWCLTCKVNEQTALDTASTAQAFAAHHVAVLEGDWTKGDAAITRFLQAHGRTGVPLYLYYPASGGEPLELPQVLTQSGLAALP
jgi:thiol:disulfide interchange protein